MNGSAAAHELVGLLLHAVTTEQSAEVHSWAREPRRLLRRTYNAATDVRRITPDHDELRIWKPAGQLVHAIVIAGRLTSPNGCAFLARILLGNRTKGVGQTNNILRNARGVNLVPSQCTIP